MRDDRKLLIETIEALGVDSATELDVTLSATGLTTGPTSTLAADLPFIEAEHRTTASDHVELQMGDQLGSGAMGVVTSAWQRSLRRWVAVKQPRSAQQASSVIQEARLAGGLDHPHIVPVHTLACIDEQPAMVMKQVEGATWRTLLRQPEHSLWADWPGDQLTRHLEILTQVCRALAT